MTPKILAPTPPYKLAHLFRSSAKDQFHVPHGENVIGSFQVVATLLYNSEVWMNGDIFSSHFSPAIGAQLGRDSIN